MSRVAGWLARPLQVGLVAVAALSCSEKDGVEASPVVGGPDTADSSSPTIEAGVTDEASAPDDEASAPDDAAVNDDAPRVAQDAECDLNGRWLVSQRVLASALGQDQAAHNWFYLEISQRGPDVVVDRGLHCGYEVVKVSSLAASVDSSSAWPAILTHDNSNGRRGSFVKEGSNCHLKLDKEYVVRGATVAYYSDPSTTLPTVSEQASGSTPGWEDWDADGNPGITLKITSALASGMLYTVQRDWTLYDGTTAQAASKFKVSITFDTEQPSLGRSAGSSSAIETTAAPSSDLTQHYAWFAKVDAGQLTGTDAEICAGVRTLKDTLVPEANQ